MPTTATPAKKAGGSRRKGSSSPAKHAPADAVKKALEGHTDDLTADQRKRSESAPAGLRGKALRTFILEGKSGTEQTREAEETRAASKRSSSNGGRAGKGGGLSTLAACEQVVRESDGPMHHKAIAEAVISGRLAPGLKGKTPEQTISAALTVSANGGGVFVKTDKGTFDVRELNPRGAKKRPKA